jgi:hypothetical protein
MSLDPCPICRQCSHILLCLHIDSSRLGDALVSGGERNEPNAHANGSVFCRLLSSQSSTHTSVILFLLLLSITKKIINLPHYPPRPGHPPNSHGRWVNIAPAHTAVIVSRAGTLRKAQLCSPRKLQAGQTGAKSLVRVEPNSASDPAEHMILARAERTSLPSRMCESSKTLAPSCLADSDH